MSRSTTLFSTIFVIAISCSESHAAPPLPGTQPLTMEGDITSQLVDGVDKFLMREIEASIARRTRPLPAGYDSREHLAEVIGAVDKRLPITQLEFISGTSHSPQVGQGTDFEAFRVRWQTLKGVYGEGLLLQPVGGKAAKALCIAIPDADQEPEHIAGLLPGVPPENQFARRLAEAGCLVVVPALVDRTDTLSIAAGGLKPTNQPHREFIYRQAFEMGRHVIGYEVQKLLSVVDWFASRPDYKEIEVGVIGYGEGGLLALNAAALDQRIDAACVSGYFGPRERVWDEPIYRNVWQLLTRFGDAELAAMIAPRPLVVDASRGPLVAGPPPAREGRTGAAPGQLVEASESAVQAEVARAKTLNTKRFPDAPLELVDSDRRAGCSSAAQERFFARLCPKDSLPTAGSTPRYDRAGFDTAQRQRRMVEQLTEYTQALVRESDYVRAKLNASANRGARDPAKYAESVKGLRDTFYNEVIGRVEQPVLPANPRTRQVYDEPKHVGYEVVLDVFPDVIAYGVLLVPKGIKDGERRPVVVCQHGLEGRPQDTIEANAGEKYYHRFAARLADEGFVTFAPQNLYIFKDRFRVLQRKGNPLGLTLFSFIVPQHQQIVDWLATLPVVDPARIGFYGLSYGGKTAMRVPALVERYCLSICSGDFNEWIWKNTSVRHRVSYIGTGEYEIFEWNLGQTFNYAEMAGLIAPRPFMVERGHRDGVAPDEWVAYEFAKVRLLYADLNIADRTELEFFDGPHTIHAVGTFDFLHRHLNWKPQP